MAPRAAAARPGVRGARTRRWLAAHVTDVLDGDAAGGDYTGTVFALAGLVLIGLAVKLAVDSVRDRPAPAAG